MRKIQEALRLHFQCGRSARGIARSLGVARSTVGEYLRRARAAGIGWPLPAGLDEVELEQRLFPPPPPATGTPRTEPNWPEIHRELRRKGVTLALLWEEYKAASPEGYRYSWFCEAYREWAGRLDLVMRRSSSRR